MSGKATSDRNQKMLLDLASMPGNDICADCKAKAPRWAAHNLGIFLCITCASIHRKIGTHISKVKNITMDEWSREQIESMKKTGNIKSNLFYNPNEVKNPPPANFMGGERDSELEKYIRAKYEYRRFIQKPQHTPESTQPRARDRTPASVSSIAPKPTAVRPTSAAPLVTREPQAPARSVSQPLAEAPQRQPPPQAGSATGNLISFDSSSSTLPLQFQAPQTNPPGPQFSQNTMSYSPVAAAGVPSYSVPNSYPSLQMQQQFPSSVHVPEFYPQQQSFIQAQPSYYPQSFMQAPHNFIQGQQSFVQAPQSFVQSQSPGYIQQLQPGVFQPQPQQAYPQQIGYSAYPSPSPSLPIQSAPTMQMGTPSPQPMFSSPSPYQMQGGHMPVNQGQWGTF